jgi:hypothetical protein
MQMKFKLPNYDDLCPAYSVLKSISRATELHRFSLTSELES